MPNMVNENPSQEPMPGTGNAVPPMGRPYKIDDAAPVAASNKPDPGGLGGGFRNTPATVFFIAANVIVFGAMVLMTGGQAFLNPPLKTLYDWGADYGPATLTGEWWRVMTSTFLHGGIVHIGMNMYVLQDVGRGVERMYGTSKFVVIYLLAGLGGSIMSLFFNPEIISVGASGAVFGCFGAFLMIIRGHAASFEKGYLQAITRSLVFLLAFNLIWGFTHKGIDNSAHIGGFITGVLAGACVLPKHFGEKHWTTQNVAWAIFLLIMLGAGGYADYLAFAGSTH
jgi:membrane associated rhomboid family serine protease